MERDEDLELLLSLQNLDCVPESPPESILRSQRLIGDSSNMAKARHTYSTSVRRVICSPAPATRSPDSPAKRVIEEQSHGYYSDEDFPRGKQTVSMAAFKDVVASSLDKTVDTQARLSGRQTTAPSLSGIDVEKHSGLRIKNRLVTSSVLSSRLLELRFVRLQAIRTAMWGEDISGAWATIGVLIEKGQPKVCSTGKNFVIWKMASLDNITIPMFLFGDAYLQHWKESAGSIIVVSNAKVRRDEKRREPSLSIFNSDQIMKLGTSTDYGVCKGLRKDGTSCTMVINRQHGQYCQYHTTTVRQKYKTKRGELTGGNLATGFADPHKYRRAQGIGTVVESISRREPMNAMKHMTSIELKKVLSNADKVTTKLHSQGIRFLTCLAENEAENVEPNKVLKRQKKVLYGPPNKRVVTERNILSTSNLEKQNRSNRHFPQELDLMELDLDGPDDAMAEAISLFHKS